MTLSDTTQLIVSNILAGGILVGALGVIWLPSLVYAAFLLGAVLLGVGCLYILLNADFLGAAQLLIYVGAINILILFAIMLVNPQKGFAPPAEQGLFGVRATRLGAGVVSGLLGVGLVYMIVMTPWGTPSLRIEQDPLSILGGHFLSDFLLPFELISVLLLVALIGAIGLARRETSVGDPR
jgi:NAD(P)H-quinone oxidoreductase subunit 6